MPFSYPERDDGAWLEYQGRMEGWILGSNDLVEFLEFKKVSKEKILHILEIIHKRDDIISIEDLDGYWYDAPNPYVEKEYLEKRIKEIEVPLKSSKGKGVFTIKFER
jgi:hypothetical protein